MEVINRTCDKFNGNADVRVVVLHHTAGHFAGDYAQLWGPAEVSIHAYITKDARIFLGVPLGKRAWHAGRSRWNGLTDINSYSIGVELENLGNGSDPWPGAQLAALDYFLTAIVRPEFGMLPITRHRDISLEGKIDPADNFPWDKYSGGIQQVTNRMTVSIPNQEADVDMLRLWKTATSPDVWLIHFGILTKRRLNPEQFKLLLGTGLKMETVTNGPWLSDPSVFKTVTG